ncbi:aldo/keto reductase [Micrococcoides hystricis]|uniref:Aldo/keto reductase n=1 Tax=Micrococcoides hystricis TaxID=1572761 RepID=A0ABV6PEI4_9MICC
MKLKTQNGTVIPQLAFGTWPLQGEEAKEAVQRVLELGYRHIDTAEAYENEEAVGEGIRSSGVPREEIFLTTKFQKKWHGRENVREALDGTLRRLGVDEIDLYLVHWPNPDQDRYVEACQGLEDLRQEGKLRNWGVSNFKPHHLKKVMEEGLRPQVNQISVNPYGPQWNIQFCNNDNGVATAAYSPLGRGSKLLDEPTLWHIGDQHCKTPAQVVLRWHLQQDRIVIPRSANPQRQAENLAIFDFELSTQELMDIDHLDRGEGPRLDADEFGH